MYHSERAIDSSGGGAFIPEINIGFHLKAIQTFQLGKTYLIHFAFLSVLQGCCQSFGTYRLVQALITIVSENQVHLGY